MKNETARVFLNSLKICRGSSCAAIWIGVGGPIVPIGPIAAGANVGVNAGVASPVGPIGAGAHVGAGVAV